MYPLLTCSVSKHVDFLQLSHLIPARRDENMKLLWPDLGSTSKQIKVQFIFISGMSFASFFFIVGEPKKSRGVCQSEASKNTTRQGRERAPALSAINCYLRAMRLARRLDEHHDRRRHSHFSLWARSLSQTLVNPSYSSSPCRSLSPPHANICRAT